MQINSNFTSALSGGVSNLNAKESGAKGAASGAGEEQISAFVSSAQESDFDAKRQIIASLNLDETDEAKSAGASDEDEDPMKKLEKLLKQLQKQLEMIRAQKDKLGDDEASQKLKEMLTTQEMAILQQMSDVIAEMEKIMEARMKAAGRA